MPTRRIDDPKDTWRGLPCRHPEHRPPGMRVFEPGTYEHICPACGKKTVFVVSPRPTLGVYEPDNGD